MSIRKSTKKELNGLPVIDLTNPTIWNPTENETDTEQYLVWEYRDGTNVIHCKAITKPGTPEIDHLKRCLGWKPVDVIKKTLENTTQYAENMVRLPMRMHFKFRYPALNVKRLRETFATNTFFQVKRPLVGILVHSYMWGRKILLQRYMA